MLPLKTTEFTNWNLQAKKQHEKKKHKEMVKKQKEKGKAKLAKLTGGTESPTQSPDRTTGRTKRPLVSDNLAVGSIIALLVIATKS